MSLTRLGVSWKMMPIRDKVGRLVQRKVRPMWRAKQQRAAPKWVERAEKVSTLLVESA
jgi:hypothetical protein